MDTELRVVEVAAGGEFAVTLDAVPTAGYRWLVDFDSSVIELLARDSRPQSTQVGAWSVEEFRFRALAPVESTVQFRYQRPWESEPHKSISYRVLAADPR